MVQTKAGINGQHSVGEPPRSLNRIFLKQFENGFTKKMARFFFTQVQAPVTLLAVNGGVLWRWDKHSLPTCGLGFAMCVVHQLLPTAQDVPGRSTIQVLTPLGGASLRWSWRETGVCHEAEENNENKNKKEKHGVKKECVLDIKNFFLESTTVENAACV